MKELGREKRVRKEEEAVLCAVRRVNGRGVWRSVMCLRVACRVVDVDDVDNGDRRCGVLCAVRVVCGAYRVVARTVGEWRCIGFLCLQPHFYTMPTPRIINVPAPALKITGGGRFGCFGQIGADGCGGGSRAA